MEPGSAPILTRAGILLLYNGADDALVYGPGWALFDRNDPAKLLARADKPFLLPERDWEKKGVVPNVIFLEGAIVAPDRARVLAIRAYYGAADRVTGAARLRISIGRLNPKPDLF